MTDQPKPPVAWSAEPSAIEVVRKSRFSWDVITRYPSGIDMCLSRPFMFRRSAERHARRVAEQHRKEALPADVHFRIDLGVERELGALGAGALAAHIAEYHPGRFCPDPDKPCRPL